MVMSRISVRNLLIEEARALGLLAFFTVAEWVAGEAYNIAANLRMVVRMCSRTDGVAYANANYGQLKIHKRSQNFSLCFLLRHIRVWIACCESRSRRGKRSQYQPVRHVFLSCQFLKFDCLLCSFLSLDLI